MMGFGETGPIVWLLAALAVIVIWGGVWWGLSALVFHRPARVRTPSVRSGHPSLQPGPRGWQQPTFDSPTAVRRPDRSAPKVRRYHNPPRTPQRRTHTESDDG